MTAPTAERPIHWICWLNGCKTNRQPQLVRLPAHVRPEQLSPEQRINIAHEALLEHQRLIHGH